jgi:hypothetical protein
MSVIEALKRSKNMWCIQFTKDEAGPDLAHKITKYCKSMDINKDAFKLYEEGNNVLVCWDLSISRDGLIPTKRDLLALKLSDEEKQQLNEFSPGEQYEAWLRSRLDSILREKKLI